MIHMISLSKEKTILVTAAVLVVLAVAVQYSGIFAPPVNTGEIGSEGINVTLLTNAGIMIEADGMRIYIDPIDLPSEYRDKPVERAALERIINSARFAPSAHNVPSTEYVVIQDDKKFQEILKLIMEYLEKTISAFKNPVIRSMIWLSDRKMVKLVMKNMSHLELLLGALKSDIDPIFFKAPVAIIFHAQKNAELGNQNANLAIQNAALMCESMGLGSFYTGYFLVLAEKNKSILQTLGIPDDHVIHGGLAIGYPKYTYKNWVDRKPAKVKWIM